MTNRTDRRHTGDREADQRVQFERDRDRVLYTSAFRRLGGITQVVHAGEGHVFHNRLTHTLEVGQIARRLAQYRKREQWGLAGHLGLDEEVAEAAALAHDLGHPPFGHIGEEQLDACMRDHGVAEGFEGNAQSFRTVCVLAVRHHDVPGLNLTRATLDAILKYPWHAQVAKGPKYGAYISESADFEFARAGHGAGDEQRSVEAEVMDWADDIAYAVHDLEDFYRAGLIPFDRLLDMSKELDWFLGRVFTRWRKGVGEAAQNELRDAFVNLLDGLSGVVEEELLVPYNGSLAQRAALRSLTSLLISRYVRGAEEPAFELSDASLGEPTVNINATARAELDMLKRLTWEYVIFNPRLASQQHGQKRVLATLFEVLRASATGSQDLLSPAMRELFSRQQEAMAAADSAALAARIAVDSICRMTEDEALRMHQRVTGIDPGSVLDAVWR